MASACHDNRVGDINKRSFHTCANKQHLCKQTTSAQSKSVKNFNAKNEFGSMAHHDIILLLHHFRSSRS